MKRDDWILAVSVLVLAVLILCVQIGMTSSKDSGYISVAVDGKPYGTYSLEEEQTVDINGKNRLVIHDGTARMEWADCPDQICTRHRAVSRNGESIICLPNRVTVTVKGRDSGRETLDGVTR